MMAAYLNKAVRVLDISGKRDWSLMKGGGGLQNGKIVCPKLFATVSWGAVIRRCN